MAERANLWKSISIWECQTWSYGQIHILKFLWFDRQRDGDAKTDKESSHLLFYFPNETEGLQQLGVGQAETKSQVLSWGHPQMQQEFKQLPITSVFHATEEEGVTSGTENQGLLLQYGIQASQYAV